MAYVSQHKMRAQLESDAMRLGFSAIAIAPAQSPDILKDNLSAFLGHNYQGTMDWMKDTFERRSDVHTLWPEVRSIIVLTMSYTPQVDPLDNLSKSDIANISVYARHRDYHDVIKGRLKELAGRFAAKVKADVKVFVDTAPIMEKPLAQMAGLGWQGKHTNLVSREQGSWFFIGSIFTNAELEPDRVETDHCGSCRACLDACPTNAFPQPYQIDARRCISYLTIEHKGPIDPEFRKKMGNRIYGCDDCLAACPWNKYAIEANEIKLNARADLLAPKLDYFLTFDDTLFRSFFSGSPIKRIGRDRFMRNVLIAAGNSGQFELVDRVKPHLTDASDIVRGAAIWALSRLLQRPEFLTLYKEAGGDTHPDVQAEWDRALDDMDNIT